MPCPAEVAEAFGVDDGSAAAGPPAPRPHRRRSRSRSAPRGSVPADAAAPRSSAPTCSGGPLYQEVEEELGRRYASATDQVSARLPTREEAELLQIRPDTPVLHLLHVAYDAEHRADRGRPGHLAGPMTSLTEEYKIPAVRPSLPTDEPDLALG